MRETCRRWGRAAVWLEGVQRKGEMGSRLMVEVAWANSISFWRRGHVSRWRDVEGEGREVVELLTAR